MGEAIQNLDVAAYARESLLSYCQLANEGYEIPHHLAVIAGALEDVEAGKINRLIITLPPRHGKSMLTSQYFPAWFMGKNPSKYIITATYGQELASDFGRKVRDHVQNPLFRSIFPVELKKDSQAAHRFETKAGGEYYAVGVGGPITGRGAHVLLVDDPIKNRQEADSEIVREGINEWYGSTAYTRLMPGGAVIIIMTRWHENDLVGYVLRNHGHENWKVINLPAINQKGKALWPERYPLDVLENIKATLPAYDWHCLFQQNPIPKEGNLFKANWLTAGLSEDGYGAKFLGIDTAISLKESADETAMSVCGVGFEKPSRFYELETIHGHYDFESQISLVKALHEKHKFAVIGVEGDRGGKILCEVLTKLGLPVVVLPAITDKYMRATTITHLYSQGRAHVNTPELRDQMLRFRGVDGDHDDLVDAHVHCLRTALQHSRASYEKKEDRYQALDPNSRRFWRNHDEHMKELLNQGQGSMRESFGF